MPDDRIYDAINMFKFSPTGQGTRSVGGDATYRNRYIALALPVTGRVPASAAMWCDGLHACRAPIQPPSVWNELCLR